MTIASTRSPIRIWSPANSSSGITPQRGFGVQVAPKQVTLDYATFFTLHSFNYTDGANPWAGVVQASNGNLYGTTLDGGANRDGTIFKITPSGALTTLYSFCSQSECKDGFDPWAGLVQAGTEVELSVPAAVAYEHQPARRFRLFSKKEAMNS